MKAEANSISSLSISALESHLSTDRSHDVVVVDVVVVDDVEAEIYMYM